MTCRIYWWSYIHYPIPSVQSMDSHFPLSHAFHVDHKTYIHTDVYHWAMMVWFHVKCVWQVWCTLFVHNRLLLVKGDKMLNMSILIREIYSLHLREVYLGVHCRYMMFIWWMLWQVPESCCLDRSQFYSESSRANWQSTDARFLWPRFLLAISFHFERATCGKSRFLMGDLCKLSVYLRPQFTK